MKLVAFVATANAGPARGFYEGTLGLKCVADDEFALAFDSHGTQLRIQKVDRVEPPPFTVLGWQVPSIRDAMKRLTKQGVSFERYPFLEQDDAGVWQAPGGTKVAWFKDPDGNLLSFAEAPD